MGKVLVKTVQINGATVTLRSFDGASWSTNLADLQRLQAERREIMASAQRVFRSIGGSDRWGSLGSSRRRANV